MAVFRLFICCYILLLLASQRTQANFINAVVIEYDRLLQKLVGIVVLQSNDSEDYKYRLPLVDLSNSRDHFDYSENDLDAKAAYRCMYVGEQIGCQVEGPLLYSPFGEFIIFAMVDPRQSTLQSDKPDRQQLEKGIVLSLDGARSICDEGKIAPQSASAIISVVEYFRALQARLGKSLPMDTEGRALLKGQVLGIWPYYSSSGFTIVDSFGS
ncbi:MAG: hypothetical protein LBI37_01205 [Puniceicoccales bacterium]|jgi:hypothetical protein|nr:hypothetical protein [Puniceicoccales bacterium]